MTQPLIDALCAPLLARLARSATSYDVDDYQQYLDKNPYGYRCHANTGNRFPETA